MKNPQALKRFVPAALAFVLVAFGTLMVLPKNDEAANADERQPTLVVTREVEAGTPASNLVTSVEVKMLEADARATGVLSSGRRSPEGAAHLRSRGWRATARFVIRCQRGGRPRSRFRRLSRFDSTTQRWVGPLVTPVTWSTFTTSAQTLRADCQGMRWFSRLRHPTNLGRETRP